MNIQLIVITQKVHMHIIMHKRAWYNTMCTKIIYEWFIKFLKQDYITGGLVFWEFLQPKFKGIY